MVPPIWDHAPVDQPAVDRLARALELEPVIAHLLCRRGLADPDAAARFLRPSIDHLHAPAHRAEHYIDDALRTELASELASPPVDPHGREIPATGDDSARQPKS